MYTMNTSSQLAAGSALDSSSVQQLNTIKEDLKTHFITREGVYRQMTLSEYSRPNRVALNQGGNNVSNAPVRVSFLTIQPTASTSQQHQAIGNIMLNGNIPTLRNLALDTDLEHNLDETDSPAYSDSDIGNDRICFNVGRELYVFVYRGVQSAVDLNKPIDKRVYKGTYPTSHDFNQETATTTSCSLIIGFSAGQIQLIDPFRNDLQISRLYNEDRLIDKTAVTCLKWIPGQQQCFLASHTSGNAYLYNENLPCNPSPPVYQIFKQGDGYTIYTCKTKTSRNPVYRWAVGTGSLHEFSFSPSDDMKLLATVSQDGFLRIFNYHSMELLAYMKSYFGGLLCLAWSPDARYIVTGGEDDLITVYSVIEKRVVCRGQGHRSWISKVAFDPYTSSATDTVGHSGVPIELGSDEDLQLSSLNSNDGLFKINRIFINNVQFNGPSSLGDLQSTSASVPLSSLKNPKGNSMPSVRSGMQTNVLTRARKDSLSVLSVAGGAYASMGVTYRIGSVGHDTQLCLWDLTESILRQTIPSQKHHTSTIISIGTDQNMVMCASLESSKSAAVDARERSYGKEKKHKRGFSFTTKLTGSSHDRWNRNHSSTTANEKDKENSAKFLGTPVCPRMEEVTVIEPLICKKIAHERLTGLIFREDCVVTACQEGFILTWARPGKAVIQRHTMNSPASVNLSGTVV
ncbi:WD domain, G-beta repeat protein [Onchocerca flexuosa]|uniref:WD domain, G-beta repeat protein n=1 Tax=Onchocerca flexuosa TaxID=387005 RepID=A0A238C573_9BILA|nr:WD domain, G-beta repeat protein [Onchocerca flexuosa]